MNTGKIIKELRKQRHLSVEEIAEKLNVNRSTFYRWERGDIEKIPYQVLIPLAKILKVNPLDLLGIDTEGITREQRMMRAFNLLSEEQQEAIILTVESMVR